MPLRAFDGFRRDARYAARALRHAPGFTLAVMLTLGLGVGANAAMLGAIDRLMLRPFPFLRDAGSVNRVYFQSLRRGRLINWNRGPYTTYLDLARTTHSFSDFAVFTDWSLAIGEADVAS